MKFDKTSNYEPNPERADQIRKAISKKISEAKSSGSTEKHHILTGVNGARDSYKYIELDLPIELLIYNTLNVRHGQIREDLINKEGLNEDYFSIENAFNAPQQQLIHQIIWNTEDFKNYNQTFPSSSTFFQRDEIWVTLDGIIVNGNTRTCWWRENSSTPTVECKVFAEDYNWDYIFKFVNQEDSGADIKSTYKWYERAKQASDWRNEGKYSADEQLLDATAYKNKRQLETMLRALELANEFVSCGFEKDGKKVQYISDFANFYAGDQLQAFTTLSEKVEKFKHLKGSNPDLFNELKNFSFNVINLNKADTSKGEGYPTVHKSIEAIWSDVEISKRNNISTEILDDDIFVEEGEVISDEEETNTSNIQLEENEILDRIKEIKEDEAELDSALAKLILKDKLHAARMKLRKDFNNYFPRPETDNKEAFEEIKLLKEELLEFYEKLKKANE